MTVFKCKMCGGTIEFEQGATVGVCDSCGTKQTLPRLDDDKKVNLYDRANHFRRNNDFDKAMSIYEQILNEDNTDAEAYWSLVLCRYGIEYVEDPASHKRIPTVNRAQFTSIFADEDYKSALQYADGYQKAIYEEEAKAIDEIQKGILEISNKEEPFDIFICYKETDNNGRRTQDSVLANDLYHQLTEEGFRVFFSRITLEDKLGIAYEPYIFAALNSAKVMVVLGTRPEYFNAVWVKNEWNRYLALIKNGAKKTLIPAYRDMDPYDLPEEFSHLQAQDMSKLGFMQDLLRGIKKIVRADAPKAAVKENVVVSGSNVNTAPLLKRAFMFLEDGNWQEADAYCERVLDQEPENAQAYLGKLMAELRVCKQEGLRDCKEPFDSRNNYQKTLRFADSALSEELKGYITHINERNETERLTGLYNNAISEMQSAKTEEAYKVAASIFKRIPGFKDADALVGQCLDKAEVCRKDALYASAIANMTGKRGATYKAAKARLQDDSTIGTENVANYEAAIKIFRMISGWKDADEQICNCQKKIEEIKAKEEALRLETERKAAARRIAAEKAAKKRKCVIAILTTLGVVCIAFFLVLKTVIIPANEYNKAISLLENGNIIDSYEILAELDGYKDSTEKAKEIFFQYEVEKLKAANVGDFVPFGSYEQDNDPSNGKEKIEWQVLDKQDNKIFLVSKYALDCQPYHTSYEDVTWEQCSLRTWLNETFLQDAFSADEQTKIASTYVSADKNPMFSTNPGNAVNDKVFLLSITEGQRYFTEDSERECSVTAYAKAQGAYTSMGNDNCRWWLRSPGSNLFYAAVVDRTASILFFGNCVNYEHDAVRPAMWIDLAP